MPPTLAELGPFDAAGVLDGGTRLDVILAQYRVGQVEQDPADCAHCSVKSHAGQGGSAGHETQPWLVLLFVAQATQVRFLGTAELFFLILQTCISLSDAAHDAVADGDDHRKHDERDGHAARDEQARREIPLAQVVGHRDGDRVREARHGQRHADARNERDPAHEQELLAELLADGLHERNQDQRGDGVRHKRGKHDAEHAENRQNRDSRVRVDSFGERRGDGVQQAGRADALAERDAAHGEQDDRPGVVVDVGGGEQAGAVEGDDGHDGDHAGGPEPRLELRLDAPQHDGEHGHEADVVLFEGEGGLDGLDGLDLDVVDLEGEDHLEPHDKEADYAQRDGEREPVAPRRVWLERLDGDDVLRRRDRRAHAAHVRHERDAEHERPRKAGLCREALEQRRDQRVREHGRRDVRDPHRQEQRHHHDGQQNAPRRRAGEEQDVRRRDARDVVLGQRGREREPADQQHDRRVPHRAEDVGRRVCGAHHLAGVGVLEHVARDHEERHEQRRGEQRDGLCGPQDRADGHDGETVALRAVVERLDAEQHAAHENGQRDLERGPAKQEPRHAEPERQPRHVDRVHLDLEHALELCLVARQHARALGVVLVLLDADHLLPDGAALENDVLAQVAAQERPRGLRGVPRHARVHLHQLVEVVVDLDERGSAEHLGPRAERLDKALADLLLQNLVELLAHLAEADLVELDERLELRQLDERLHNALFVAHLVLEREVQLAVAQQRRERGRALEVVLVIVARVALDVAGPHPLQVLLRLLVVVQVPEQPVDLAENLLLLRGVEAVDLAQLLQQSRLKHRRRRHLVQIDLRQVQRLLLRNRLELQSLRRRLLLLAPQRAHLVHERHLPPGHPGELEPGEIRPRVVVGRVRRGQLRGRRVGVVVLQHELLQLVDQLLERRVRQIVLLPLGDGVELQRVRELHDAGSWH
ncbi:hypothetical protein KL912_003065 [Ogataea haglerorum]|nr:hypothetical protein KL912_003065 [Ogataea haglerorum]